MHRFNYTKLTKEQIGTKLKPAEVSGPRSASSFSNVLNGKALKIVTQGGPTLDYKFGANRQLTLSEAGKQCDLAIWNIERPAELVYRMGFNPLHARVWRGH